MKFSESAIALTKKTAQEIRDKRSTFIAETETKKAVHIVLITPIGLKRNDYSDLVQSVVTTSDLLRQ